MRAVGEMPETAPITVTRRDRARGQRAPVISAHEGKHQVPARGVAHDLERVLDRLRAAHVEMDAAVDAESRCVQPADRSGELDLLRV